MTISRLPTIVATASAVSIALAAAAVQAAPRHLRDGALRAITAGNASVAAATPNGGTVVAGNSSANVSVSAAVTADDSQTSAKAVNLVDASGSAIANGANLWDGNASDASTGLTVNQTNTVLQSGTQSASLGSYVRSKPNISGTTNTSSAMTNQGSVNTSTTVLKQTLQGGEGIALSGSVDANFTGGSISYDNPVKIGKISTDQTFTWTLPGFSAQAALAGCMVDFGSCNATGSYSTRAHRTLNSQGPLALRSAQGKYVVVDGSKLTAQNSYQVALTGGTESGASALNIVNASGSSVSDGVNVAYTTGTSPGLTLNQVNTVVQYR